MSRLCVAEVVQNRPIADEHFALSLCAEGFEPATPGQFVMIGCGAGPLAPAEPLLRRPFSLCDVDPEAARFDLIYRRQGRGTAVLSTWRALDRVSVLGPLGRGFTWGRGVARPGLVGGGVGVPPLVYLARRMLAHGALPRAFIGFARSNIAICQDRFQAIGVPVQLATNDGSAGHRGFVTELVEREAAAGRIDSLFACGPVPMLAAIAQLARRYGLPCQLCLEALMGCGVGACLTCVWPVRPGPRGLGGGSEPAPKGALDAGEPEPWQPSYAGYRRVCREGPVFAAEEVVFDAIAPPRG